MAGFIYYLDGLPLPTFTYYINGEAVKRPTAYAYLLECCTEEQAADYWRGRYDEEGRDALFDATNCTLEIVIHQSDE
jgi:hypothetical protein